VTRRQRPGYGPGEPATRTFTKDVRTARGTGRAASAYGHVASGFGALIRGRRRAAGLTQQQLAEAAAVSIGALRDLEQGRTAPLLCTARTLAAKAP
jgi:DNA-binding XRE family transcriptional regulator